LRKHYPALTSGQLVWLTNSDPSRIVSFLRQDDKDEFVVVINFSNRPTTGTLTVEGAPEFREMAIAGLPGGSSDNLTNFQLDGFGWRIFHRNVIKLASQR
jgi:glycosidase